MENTMRPRTATMTSRAISIPRQLRWFGVEATSSCNENAVLKYTLWTKFRVSQQHMTLNNMHLFKEECHLLGYKNPVRTSRVTLRLHYTAQTVKLCKVWGFHGGDWRMTSSWMSRRVALVRTEVSEKHIGSIVKVTRIGELGTMLAVTSNRSTPRSSAASYKSHTV
jgi:hypothetical protein